MLEFQNSNKRSSVALSKSYYEDYDVESETEAPVPQKRAAKKTGKRQSSNAFNQKRKVDHEDQQDVDVKRIKAEPDQSGSGVEDDNVGNDFDAGNDDDDFDSFNQFDLDESGAGTSGGNSRSLANAKGKLSTILFDVSIQNWPSLA